MSRLVEFWNEHSAELLRNALETRGLRVEELAEKLAVTPRTVRYWMRKHPRPVRPSVHNLRDLCIHLGLTPDDFRAAAVPAPQPPSAPPLPAPSHQRASRRWLFIAAGVIALAAIAWLVVRSRWAAPPRAVSIPVTFEIPPRLAGVYDTAFGSDVSPDGTQIAFLARSLTTMRRMLFVHSVVDRSTRPLPGSEGNYTSFFWSSDGRSIFFINKVDLMRISIGGAAPERVGFAGEATKGTANAAGVVIVGSRKGLMKVAGGVSEMLTHTRPGEVAHAMPFFLPDGDRALFTITQDSSHTLAVVSVSTRSVRPLFPIPSRAQYANGQLLYVREHTLFARPFDADALRFTGAERPLASPIWWDSLTGEAGFSASESTLVMTPPLGVPPLQQLTFDGKPRGAITDPPNILFVAAGRTARQLAIVSRRDEGDDLWLYPLDGRQRVRLLSARGQPSSPLFSADDRRIYFANSGTTWANIYAVDVAGGAPRPVLSVDALVAPRDASPDGRYLLFQRWVNRDGNLWYMPVDKPAEARELVATPEDEGESARFSPDGKRVAFVARRGADYSIYVVPFPPNGEAAAQAVHGDGWRARWSGDGKHIYFARGASVMEADPLTHRTWKLFDMKREITMFEVAPDGFFIREIADEPDRTVATVWWPRLADHPLNLRDSDSR